MSDVLINVCKVLVFDFVVILLSLIAVYLFMVIFNLIRNGKSHKITNKNVFGYSFKRLSLFIRKNFSQFFKWLLIIVAVHLILVFFSGLFDWCKSSDSYDSVPVFALIIDVLSSIINFLLPVILPICIVICVIILIYALVKTVERCAKENPTGSKACKVSKSDKVAYFTEYLQGGFLGSVKILPKLFIVIAVCVAINSILLSINNIIKIFDNYKRIQELNLTVKNLANSEAFTRVSLINVDDRGPGRAPVKTYKIEVLSANGDVISGQTMQMEGEQIVLDAININFDYSKIASGEKYNIAYPYRVYSEVVPAVRAKDITCMFNDKNLPVIYCLDQSEIYGLDEDVYYNRLAELFDIIKDDNRCREAGIRSSIGNAIHLNMHEHDVIDLNIEGTGGISVSHHESLFDSDEERDF